MRPRKKILLIGPSELWHSEMRLILGVHGYAPMSVASIGEVSTVDIPDMIIGHWPIDEAEFSKRGRDMNRPTLLIAPRDVASNLSDRTVNSAITTAELLDAIKLLVVRKRGPMKGQKRIVARAPIAVLREEAA